MKFDIKKILCDFDNAMQHQEGGRLLSLVQWDDAAEPVLDLREWTMEDGRLLPGEGLTFDLYGAVTLYKALTDLIVQAAVDGRKVI